MLEEIKDAKEIKTLIQMTNEVTDKEMNFKESFLIKNKWAAVPIEGGYFVNPKDEGTSLFENNFIKFCLSMNYRYLFAIDPEINYENFFNQDYKYYKSGIFKVDILENDTFINLHMEYPFNCLLFPEDLSFSVICTCEDYDIIAGKKEFISEIVGDIETARKKFFEFACEDNPLEDLKTFWISVSKRYEKFNGE